MSERHRLDYLFLYFYGLPRPGSGYPGTYRALAIFILEQSDDEIRLSPAKDVRLQP